MEYQLNVSRGDDESGTWRTSDMASRASRSSSERLELRGVGLSHPLRAAFYGSSEAERVTPFLGERIPASPQRGVARDSDALRDVSVDVEAPSILDVDERDRPTFVPAKAWGQSGIWIASSLVASAYGCWVLLLDYL